MLPGGGPRLKAKVAEPLDLLPVVNQLRAAGHQDAPPGLGLRVVVVGLEGAQPLRGGRAELRPPGGAEDHALPIHGMVHRQDHHLAVAVEGDPAQRDRSEQPQAHVERQHLQPGLVERGAILDGASGCNQLFPPKVPCRPQRTQRAEVPDGRVLWLYDLAHCRPESSPESPPGPFRRDAGGGVMTADSYATAADLVTRAAAAYAASVPDNPSDDGFFGPASVPWRVSNDLASPVAGLRSLLMQALHPLAMAGVDQHSGWRPDPVGRLAATSGYETTARFG